MVKKKQTNITVATYRDVPLIPDESDETLKNVIYGKALWKQMNLRPNVFGAYPKTGFHPCSVCGEYKDSMKIIGDINAPDDITVICEECYEESQYTSKW